MDSREATANDDRVTELLPNIGLQPTAAGAILSRIRLKRHPPWTPARLTRLCYAVVVSSVAGACTTVGLVQLRPGDNVVLRVGQRASLTVPSEAGFSIGQAGSALHLIKQEQRGKRTVFLYRADHAGKQTFVATPKEPGPDGCVSCVTEHYFVEVIQ